jgi:hypothetical protein
MLTQQVLGRLLLPSLLLLLTGPYELYALEVGNKKSHRKKAKKLTRITQSLKRRKSRQMGNQSFKHYETVIVEYSVSNNRIKNRNAIIRSGRELVSEDEASSSIYRPATNYGYQANEPVHPDNWAEANAFWDVGKVILQGHNDSRLMTQTLQGFIEREQEEWIRRKKA